MIELDAELEDWRTVTDYEVLH